MSDSFIDGLKPRSEKIREIGAQNQKRGRFSSGYTSIEFGDSNISRTNRKQIDKIVEQTKISKKAPEPKKIKTPMKKSYARDVLGIEEDDELVVGGGGGGNVPVAEAGAGVVCVGLSSTNFAVGALSATDGVFPPLPL